MQVHQGQADKARLADDVIKLADKYGRYEFCIVPYLLNIAGWQVKHKRVGRAYVVAT